MSTLREAAQQALEALEATHYDVGSAERQRLGAVDAITALRDALEQQGQEQEQEPVASIYVTIDGGREFDDWRCPLPVGRNFLYTHPPRREWRSLTDDEISALFSSSLRSDYKPYSFARAIEAKLKEKNA